MLPLRDDVPRQKIPLATGLIISINIIIYIQQARLPEVTLHRVIETYGLIPIYFRQNPAGEFHTIFTSMFMHGGLGHLIVNMWILALFGDNVEDRMGRISFLIFYLLSGLAASSTHMYFNINSIIPVIGASGAVAGVMAAYAFLFPSARVLTMIPIFIFPYITTLPAFVFMGFWFLTQVYYGTMTLTMGASYGGIAWWAHIGGFVFGAFFYRIFVRRRSDLIGY
ncbi:rhomboid family intramembrane serine protease [Halarsenatibacter silvermanii]|uniref:Membrane associated serine protease, rhomboid family n=1 Tax=Halarsenatibacter silvermanii TaxID=321763 RepID=A0A1G9PSE8_9FIRM|nr:rhomboid family intramembrane serine protease [Halarsenatibacter silvermanii]SDM01583.1 Membrane associated serine protease, rhomboid family [Halarsenatibacter silvermanii]